MKIFFTGSIRGGRGLQKQYKEITEILTRYGSVSGGHIADDDMLTHGETHLSAREISTRELSALQESDAVVAEVTTPSLGVGYLIAHAGILQKPVIALCNSDDSLMVSAIIKGDPNVKVYLYKTSGGLERIFEEALRGIKK